MLKVVDGLGNVIEDNLKPNPKRVLDEGVADTLNNVLQGPLQSGTARGKGIDRPAAGKTGSTNDNKDAWFVGYTPDLSVAVSMGYDRPEPLQAHQGRVAPCTAGRFRRRRGSRSCVTPSRACR